jgi:hypothetical protein
MSYESTEMQRRRGAENDSGAFGAGSSLGFRLGMPGAGAGAGGSIGAENSTR